MNRIVYKGLMALLLLVCLNNVYAVQGTLKLVNANGTGDKMLYLLYSQATTGALPSVIKVDILYFVTSLRIGNISLGGNTGAYTDGTLSSSHSLHVNASDANSGKISIIIAPSTKNTVLPSGIIATLPIKIFAGARILTVAVQNIQISDGTSSSTLTSFAAEASPRGDAGDRGGDRVPDYLDLYPDDPLRSRDTDGDGIADYDDPDDDNDGILDAVDTKLNVFPVANAGNDIVANAGETITLDGTRSYDLDGEIVSYYWAPANLLVGANTSTPTYTIPANATASTQSFVLTVKDGADGAGDTVNVVIVPSLRS